MVHADIIEREENQDLVSSPADIMKLRVSPIERSTESWVPLKKEIMLKLQAEELGVAPRTIARNPGCIIVDKLASPHEHTTLIGHGGVNKAGHEACRLHDSESVFVHAQEVEGADFTENVTTIYMAVRALQNRLAGELLEFKPHCADGSQFWR
eukprot:1145191-Pelagomonas_calceolata.AAC.3